MKITKHWIFKIWITLKVNTCFSWSGRAAGSDQWNDLKKILNNAITTVKMSKKGQIFWEKWLLKTKKFWRKPFLAI